MKIAVIGANGQLGWDICAAFEQAGDEIIALTHADIEIAHIDSVEECLHAIGPDMVVNTAAFTNVPLCETKKEDAYTINAIGAKNIACISRDLKATLFHISTDYVFNGKGQRPYVETDRPDPINVYGATKLAGENFIKEVAEKYCILRVSGIYGKHPCRGKGGLNFIETILERARKRSEVRVVDDEVLTPTATVEIARQIVAMRDIEDYGIYHATAEGECSWFEFAQELFRIKKIATPLVKAQPGEFASVVKRPHYSVLENERLNALGMNVFKHWRDGLKEYLIK